MRRNIQALGGKDKCVRRRFRGGHIVSGYHRDRCRDLEVPKQLINLRAFAAGGQGPARADLVKILQQLFRAGLDANLRNHLAEDAGAYLFYGLNFRFVDLLAEFAEKCGKKEAPAHADAAVNFPVRQANLDIFERFAPSHYVFVNAVNKRAIKIEKKRWDALRGGRLGNYTDTAVILRARTKPAVTGVLHSSTAKCQRGVSCIHVSWVREMFLYPVCGIFR